MDLLNSTTSRRAMAFQLTAYHGGKYEFCIYILEQNNETWGKVLMELIPYILIILVAVIGGVSTLVIGHSKANKVSNPEYDNRTKVNWSKLSWIYITAAAVIFAAAAIYLSIYFA
ncbi:hypothetical protein [Paenibacillus sp. SN-8-1]|uniref:hypothetical protein n=1 Tax=Paenibacillus sp. SN-8-1 TaxID=3435409 RepID=UPI003D9AB3A7